MRRLLLSMLLCGFAAVSIAAQTTAFSYQGSLKDGANPANGNFDFEFKLFDAVSAGTQQGSALQRLNVAVANGVFAVSLDFGSVTLPGANRYLEIGVRAAGGGAFTPLTPRQQLNSAPYSIKSLNSTTADLAANATQLGGVTANQYVLTTDPRLSDPRPPTAGSANYIQNQSAAPQSAGNFNISGTGTGNILNAVTQFNLNGSRILSSPLTNLFIGQNSGATNTSGDLNTFAGYESGFANTTGNTNAFYGAYSGNSNIDGHSNVFFGVNSGRSNISGIGNAFFGSGTFPLGTGQYNTTGSFNVYFGHRAGEKNNGNSNTYLGTAAGRIDQSGNSNTFIGHDAGDTNDGGTFNVVVGDSADVGSVNLTNATAVGSKALVTQSNSLILGSINGVNGSTTDTNVGIGTTAPQKTLHVVGQDIRVQGSSSSISPRFSLVHTGGSAGGTPDSGKWQNYAVYDPFFGGLRFSALNDAENQESIWLNVVRTPGITINRVEFPSGYVAIGNDLLVGTTSVIPTRRLDVRGSALVLDSLNLGLRVQTTTTGGTVASFGGNGDFQVDAPGIGGGRFTILENGNVGIGTNSPSSKLHVNGTIRMVAASGGTQNLCWAADGQIATCSSSLRYKTNIGNFSTGMSFVNQLRPISFDWKDGGLKDVGFGAEEIAKIDPRFVTFNDKGEVEGVKYDRISVAFVNALKEQQSQIESQQKQIEQQRSEIDALKALVCSQNPGAAICTPKN